ncbi:exported hypothetical protein [Candidatus Terasakiella magnetica]|uniref:Uncharacterized protein n=1 Tax=Candidatus Terasakiella magnetica TaxID=1867952 RepID=A0A1C3REI9_9PROT|nr:hypothetical protein [Candidatus Terasakiella magnetica]SCA55652.1 exported hypothetical protein [Candidatus Terasakiella magnetica]
MTMIEISAVTMIAASLSAAVALRVYGQKRLSLLLARLTRP